MNGRPLTTSALLALLLGGCATVPPEVPYPLTPESRAPVAWKDVFSKPVKLEVIPLFTGEVEVDRSLVLNLDHPDLKDKEDRSFWVPVMAYLVRHPTQGAILIDSGLDSSFTESGNGNIHGLGHFFDPFRQKEGFDTVSLLKAAGVEPKQLKAMFISHMHVDHTAGMPELPRTVPVIAGPKATEGYEPLWYASWDHLDGYPRIQTIDFSGVKDTGPGPAVDVFGDGSLFVIDAPGHVPGNISFLLNTTKGPLLLTCDACHIKEGFDQGVEPGLASDREAAARTLKRFRSFVKAFPKVRVIQGHEPSLWDLKRGVQDPL